MDETIITPDIEVKDVIEGTVEAQIQTEAKADPAPETVPLQVYLELKKDLKELKNEIKESKDSDKSSTKIEGLEDLTKKYPDVSEDFIKDMLNSATKVAAKQIDEKYTPIIQKQEEEKKQQAFDKAFDNLFDKTIKDNPELPKNIDKELIKELAVTPKYRNIPLSDILIKMYGSVPEQGRASSENDSRSSADRVDDIVSFDKITPQQRSDILDDPKARTKYFAWLDTQIGR